MSQARLGVKLSAMAERKIPSAPPEEATPSMDRALTLAVPARNAQLEILAPRKGRRVSMIHEASWCSMRQQARQGR